MIHSRLLYMAKVIVFVFLIGPLLPSQAAVVWYWQDNFNRQEQAKLTQWITQTIDSIEQLVHPYPFDLHIYFHRIDHASEPTPWAHTQRSRRQGVHFHVDPSYPLHDFLADWTAPHELSHLLLPYLGRNNAWFAEGFASYMQYQIMQQMGVMTPASVQSKYRWHITRAAKRYPFDNTPFSLATGALVSRGQYPTMYWGGAVYFLQAEKALASRDSSFIELLAEYVECCRLKPTSLASLVRRFDQLSNGSRFNTLLTEMQNTPGFPSYDTLF